MGPARQTANHGRTMIAPRMMIMIIIVSSGATMMMLIAT
jgi:hypothetical protein